MWVKTWGPLLPSHLCFESTAWSHYRLSLHTVLYHTQHAMGLWDHTVSRTRVLFPFKSPCILDFVNKTSIKYLQHQDVTICYFFVCYVVTGLGDLLLAVFSVAAAQIIKKEIWMSITLPVQLFIKPLNKFVFSGRFSLSLEEWVQAVIILVVINSFLWISQTLHWLWNPSF